jgi:hypothetical protein
MHSVVLTNDELVRTGQAEIRCTKCGTEVPIKSVIKNDDQGRPGWNFDRIECPNGHELMEVETFHVSFS